MVFGCCFYESEDFLVLCRSVVGQAETVLFQPSRSGMYQKVSELQHGREMRITFVPPFVSVSHLHMSASVTAESVLPQ